MSDTRLGGLRNALMGSGSIRRPRVTVIIPVHNGEKFLEACLESVLGQSLRSIEVTCIDDNSTDESATILKRVQRADRRLRVLQNAKNMGAAMSRNRGLAEARGCFTRFVDCDDLLPPESLEILHAAAVRNRADVSGGSLVAFRDDDLMSVLSREELPERPVTSLRNERKLWIPWFFYRYLISTRLLHARKIRFPALHAGEDAPFLADVLVAAERVSLTSEVVYTYRKYPKADGSAARGLCALGSWLDHVEMVKEAFLSYDRRCWIDGYGPFTKNFAGAAILDGLEGGWPEGRPSWRELGGLRDRAIRIWGSEYDPSAVRRSAWWPSEWTRPADGRPPAFDSGTETCGEGA